MAEKEKNDKWIYISSMSLSDEIFRHEKVLPVSMFPPELVGIVRGWWGMEAIWEMHGAKWG